MTFISAIQQIDSHEFSANLGLANNLEMFFALARQNKAVNDLLPMLSDQLIGRQLLVHAISMIREQDDVHFRNSRDAAIGVYVWALAQTQPRLAQLAASSALAAPRLWWAKRVALNVVSGKLSKGMSETTTSESATNQFDWAARGVQGKDVLILSSPPEDLISDGRVLDPGNLILKSDDIETENTDADYFTLDSNQTEVVQND